MSSRHCLSKPSHWEAFTKVCFRVYDYLSVIYVVVWRKKCSSIVKFFYVVEKKTLMFIWDGILIWSLHVKFVSWMCQSFCLDINLENKLCNRNIFTIVSKKKQLILMLIQHFFIQHQCGRMKLICPFALSTTSILRYCFYFIVTFYKY